VAKPADAKDLKSFSRQRECGFDSHPGHQENKRLARSPSEERRLWKQQTHPADGMLG